MHLTNKLIPSGPDIGPLIAGSSNAFGDERFPARQHVDVTLCAGRKFPVLRHVLGLPDKTGDVHWMDFQTTVQVTKDFMRHNPETVSAMLAALQKATDFVNNNRDESLDILSDELQIERSQLQQMMNRNMYSMVIDDRFVQGSQATGSETRYKTTAATASARPTPMA